MVLGHRFSVLPELFSRRVLDLSPRRRPAGRPAEYVSLSFLQDSYKLKSNLTLNYGLRWELNTPYYDTRQPASDFPSGPGHHTVSLLAPQRRIRGPWDLSRRRLRRRTRRARNNAVFPLGLVFPGDKGVPRGLTSTYYKGFAPRIGIAWSPGRDRWLACEVDWRPRQIQHSRGFRNLL